MTYLYWHALGAVLAMWLLIRTVSCGNLVGLIALLACGVLGPVALAAAVCCGLFAASSEMSRREQQRHDAAEWLAKHEPRE